MSVDTSGGHPEMDYREHERTYAGFVQGVKWSVIATIAVLVLIAFLTL